jgi:hypothetical protein
MNDDFPIGALCFGIFATVAVVFLLGSRFAFDDGMVKGKHEGIVFCMEHQKECKISYDYLKLQENQK